MLSRAAAMFLEKEVNALLPKTWHCRLNACTSMDNNEDLCSTLY